MHLLEFSCHTNKRKKFTYEDKVFVCAVKAATRRYYFIQHVKMNSV